MAKEETTSQQPHGEKAIDRALQRFSEMLIERMEAQQKDWHQGWIGGGTVLGLPQNITGRTYEGSNAFLLYVYTAMQRYKAPVFATFPQISKEGAHILKGEKSIPVFKWGLSIKDKDGKRMSERDYRNLPEEEQKECVVRPYLKVYAEYNIDQTNLAEVNKERYDSLVARFKPREISQLTDGMYVNAAVDRMFENQEWVCPILYKEESPRAYYSPSNDIVVLPTKAQFNLHPDDPEECFKDGQEYYGTAFHEMAHSTGHESRLNRGKSSGFGSPEYAKEELVAELTSAMIGNALGFDRRISDNNIGYLQSWISTLRKEPKFLVSVMSDVNKASKMIIDSIDKQRIALGEAPLMQGALDGIEEKVKNDQQLEAARNAELSNKTSKESELLQLLGFPDQKEYYNEIDLSKPDESAGDFQELYDKAQLAELWLNGENDKIIEILRMAKEKSGATFDGTLLSSFKGEIANAEKLGEDNKFLYYLSSNDSENFQMYEKVSREALLHQYLPQHLDREILSVEGYADGQINVILAKAEEAGLRFPKQEGLPSVKEQSVEAQQEVPREEHSQEVELSTNLSNPRDYFSTLMSSINDGEHEEHTALDIKNMKELRAYFKDNPHVGEWVSEATDKDLIEAGAELLPNLRHSHKDGRTLYDIETTYSNINARYEDVRDERTRQIAHRVRQAGAIVTAYHNNIESAHEAGFLFKEDSIHKLLPREEYSASVSQTVQATNRDSNMEEEKYYYSFNYLQSTDSTEEFDKLQDGQDYKGILQLAEQYDQGDALEQKDTYKSAEKYPGDDLLDEDDRYAVVYNNQAGGTYELLRKVSKQDILDNVERYGLDAEATEDVKELVRSTQEQSVAPHEDGNLQSDLAGKAKEIAATGIPMEEAEKQAQTIVNNELHKQYHEEEANAAEQKKAKEAKEPAKKQEENLEKESEEVKEGIAISHVALLVGALEKAKEHDGVWMNLNKKANAEFLNTHTPITAYNNIMMVLNSDANKYKTNVYTYFNPAKQNGMPVMLKQEGMSFHWTSWQYQNAMNKDDVIDKKKYDSLPSEEKSFYVKHATRQSQTIYNVDQTAMKGSRHKDYEDLVRTKGIGDRLKQKDKSATMLANYDTIQKKHPEAVIIARANDFYEIYREKAKLIAPILSLELQEKTVKGKKIPFVSFPHHQLDTVLPKLIRAQYRVAITDQLTSPRSASKSQDYKDVVNKACEIARSVAQQSGMQYERVMVMQDAKYDVKEDKIVVSGMKPEFGNEQQSNLYKANDIYRSVVAAIGSENRLDRSGRNNLLPEDDSKHEKLVEELAAGVLMARQGLPAVLSKENESLISYWQREIKENPHLMGIIERDVNNSVQVIDDLVAKRKVNYEAIRGQLPLKMMTEHPANYSIVKDLGKLPSIETKEIVIVKDMPNKRADVILPAGASLEVNNEVPGMSKARIAHALKKMGIMEVSFHNASGALGLNKPNEYFQGKEVTVNKLKQYELLVHHTLDVASQAVPKKEAVIKTFQAITDDKGKYAFFIKPENEPSFSVYPTREHLNRFFSVIKTDNESLVHKALAQKYYEMATKHPDAKKQLIMPKEVKGVDMNLIQRPSITSSAQDSTKKIIFATINGERVQAPVTKMQWKKMWLAEDMAAYKKGLAAVIFASMLKREMGGETAQREVREQEDSKVKETPAPEKKPEEEETESKSKGIRI